MVIMKTLSLFQLNFKNKFSFVTDPGSELPFESSVYLRFINKNFGAEPVIVSQSPLPNTDTNCKELMDAVASASPDARRDAISVRNAWKRYGKSEKGTQVLSDLTLTVQEGTIYTLLGSSGCGKTTLLSCIVGTTELDQGTCKIFGKIPGSRGCGVPGKKVGYMPQEIALYGEFTIKEAMLYFGKINGMSTVQIVDRMTFLIRFLHLPPSHRPIRSLSGGQQRRVSFAVALLHEPRILILDEPTVGVDPLLRQSIWKHLTELVETGNTTVVITTHYIEEANEAHRIGLMRNGRLLAEDSPQRLLEEFECSKLEEVFFKLSVKDTHNDEFASVRSSDSSLRSSKVSAEDAENASANEDATTTSSLETDMSTETTTSTVAVCNEKSNESQAPQSNDTEEPPAPPPLPPMAPSPTSPVFNRSVEQLIDDTESRTKENKQNNNNAKKEKAQSPKKTKLKWRRKSPKKEVDDDDSICIESCKETFYKECLGICNIMVALLLKNFLCMWRNIGFVLFIFLLPALQAILFCIAIGGDPTGLPLGIINHEVMNISGCHVTPGCSIMNMSCNFIKMISNTTIHLKTYTNESVALKDVEEGNIWGYVVIPSNFSDAMIQKGVSGKHGSSLYEDGFQGTHIKLHLDMTSQQIAFTIQRTLSMSFQKFATNLLFDCGMNDTIDLPPASFAEPIYGGPSSSFREFMAPGIILSIIFFMSVALTGSAFITERKEGMLNRTLVSGVTTGEIITAHLLTQYVIMTGQTILVLAVMIWVFQVQIEGSVTAAVLLTLCQGTCGMAFGFLISCVCTDERNAIQMALGSFYPNLLLSGVVWPLESIPGILRNIALFLPQTMACEAMRSIFSRAWGFDHPKVWPGFAASSVWSLVFWLCALCLARFHKK